MLPIEGFSYKDEILVSQQENGNTVYSGKLKGQQAKLIVSADKVISFEYGDKTYGPYKVKLDATAIPENSDLSEYMTGVEVLCGNKVLFRGGVMKYGARFSLYNEDGSGYSQTIAMMSDGTMVDTDGNEIDPVEPTVSEIIELYFGPR